MEQYCKTLDITYIDRETKRNKKIIKEVLKGVKLSDIPKDKKHIYYIMYTYFYPSKIESHSNSYCSCPALPACQQIAKSMPYCTPLWVPSHACWQHQWHRV